MRGTRPMTKIYRGRIIKRCLNGALSELGFHYKCYRENTFIFERNREKFAQYIYIYIYRYDPWQITFHLGTDIPGTWQVFAHQIDGVKGNGDILGYWKYHDKESLVNVLQEILQILQSRGIEILEKISAHVPDKIDTNDSELHHELYYHHQELAEAFVEKTGMTSTGYDEENLKKWFDYMAPRLEEIRKGPEDSAAKREFLEMAAFLGEQIVKYKGGIWDLYKDKKVEVAHILYKKKVWINEETEICLNVIRVMVRGYLGNNRQWLEESFYEVISEYKYYM